MPDSPFFRKLKKDEEQDRRDREYRQAELNREIEEAGGWRNYSINLLFKDNGVLKNLRRK